MQLEPIRRAFEENNKGGTNRHPQQKTMKHGERYFANMRGAKVIKVIAVEVNEGEGNEDDPIQRVLYIYDLEGNYLAHIGDTKKREYFEKNFMIIK